MLVMRLAVNVFPVSLVCLFKTADEEKLAEGIARVSVDLLAIGLNLVADEQRFELARHLHATELIFVTSDLLTS